MKKILLFTENLGSGGAERQLTGLAVLLKNAGYVVKVVTYIKAQHYESFLRENGVDYEFRKDLAPQSFRVWRLLKLFRQWQPDVVISFLPSPNMVCCLASFFYKCKFIVSERSYTGSLSLKGRITFGLYRRATWIVTNSYAEGENISQRFPSLKNKIKVITNFVDTDTFSPAEKYISKNPPMILTVGRILPVKNYLRYCEAVRMIKDSGMRVEFIWVGKPNDDEQLHLFKEKIQKEGVGDLVKLMPESNDIINYYRQADILLLPSLHEGYPNVLVEAMSCGLPIICSNVCEMPKIVEDGVNGFLFNPQDVNDIVYIMKKILDYSYEQRFEMGCRNRKKIVDNNSKIAFIENYLKLLS